MSLLTVVQDVCAVVGVTVPTTVFANINTNRTMQEMAALASEMAQRITSDVGHDWQLLRLRATHVGDGVATEFLLPANYKRMLLTSQVRSSTYPDQPLTFISDFDEWTARRLSNATYTARGEWTLVGGKLNVAPAPAVGVQITYPYLDKNGITLNGGGVGDRFVNDADSFRLDERLLKLAMIYQWKAHKGSPYAEDMATYGDALTMAMGKDNPSPIIIDRLPSSNWGSTKVAYPWPVPT